MFRKITVRAFSLYKSKFGTLLGFSFFNMLIFAILGGVYRAFYWLPLSAYFIAILIYPVFPMGCSHYYLEFYRGNQPVFIDLFHYFSKKLLPTALLLGLFQILYAVVNIFSTAFITLAELTHHLPLALFFSIVFFVFTLWFMFRFWLIPYVFSSYPHKRAKQIIAESYHKTKGCCLKFFLLSLYISWWYILALLLIFLRARSAADFSTLFLIVIGVIIFTFLVLPYFQLSVAGFADMVLHDDKEEIAVEEKVEVQ